MAIQSQKYPLNKGLGPNSIKYYILIAYLLLDRFVSRSAHMDNIMITPVTVVTVKMELGASGFVCLFGVLCHFQHCTGHITTGSFVGRGDQYIQLIKVLYCKLPAIGKQLPTVPHKVWGLNRRPERWRRVCHHRGPRSQWMTNKKIVY